MKGWVAWFSLLVVDGACSNDAEVRTKWNCTCFGMDTESCTFEHPSFRRSTPGGQEVVDSGCCTATEAACTCEGDTDEGCHCGDAALGLDACPDA